MRSPQPVSMRPAAARWVVVGFLSLALFPSMATAQVTACGPLEGPLGKLLGGLGVTSADDSWQKLDPGVRQCVIKRLGMSVQELGRRCVTPTDQRVQPHVQSCSASVEKQKRDQAAADEAKRKAEARTRELQQQAAAREREAKQAAEAAAQERKDARRRELAEKYGDNADAILAGQIRQGMTKQEVFEARGAPRGRDVVPPMDELWRYNSGRVVFTDGKVTYLDPVLGQAMVGR